MQILKFGGSILRTSNDITRLCDIVAATRAHGTDAATGSGKAVIVVSALGASTRNLETASLLAATGKYSNAVDVVDRLRQGIMDLAQGVLRKEQTIESFKSRDFELFARCCSILQGISITRQRTTRVGHIIRALGEDWAIALVSLALRERDIVFEEIDARSVMKTHTTAGESVPDMDATADAVHSFVVPALRRSSTVLIQGYVASDDIGDTTTMGSESSNLTAAVLGRILAAESVTVYSDVPGIMTIDPNVCQDAQVIEQLDYSSAHKLAVHGVKILYPTMIPILEAASIPLNVCSLRPSSSQGTTIRHTSTSSPLRSIICQYPTTQRLESKLNDNGSYKSPNEVVINLGNELIRAESASIRARIVDSSLQQDHEDGTEITTGLITIFHSGVTTVQILQSVTNYSQLQSVSHVGVWTFGPETTCVNIQAQHLQPLATHIHALLT